MILQVCGDLFTVGCYDAIQDAVNAASNGDIIELLPRVYREHVTIALRDLTIQGDSGSLILDPPRATDDEVFEIAGNNVTFTGVVIATSRARPMLVIDNAVVTVKDSTIRSDGVQTEGGLVRIETGAFNCDTSTLGPGTALDGGLIFATDALVALGPDCRLASGTALRNGGAIASQNHDNQPHPVTLAGAVIQDCTASGRGGALWLGVGISATLVDATLLHDSAVGDGGAIWSADAVTLIGGDLLDNHSEGNGGAVALGGNGGNVHSLSVLTTRFVDDTAVLGGAIDAKHGTIGISGASFYGSNASEAGGAIHLEASAGPVVVQDDTFCTGRAPSGAAIWSEAPGTVIQNSRFYANTNAPGGRGSVLLLGASADILHNHFVGNATVRTAIATVLDGDVTFADDLVAFNIARPDPTAPNAARLGLEVVAGTLTVASSDFWENDVSAWALDTGTAFAGDPHLDRFDLDDACNPEDPYRGQVAGYISWGSELVNAGTIGVDPDSSPPDIGAFGGPNANGTAWQDWDGDGWPNLYDCASDSVDIHPEAADAPYDGLDANCDFASDDDADLDGHDDVQHGGDDCDDADPAIHPGAVDIPYDEIDQDCLAGPEKDLDNDSWDSPADCDDNDPRTHPGIVETPGGGDQDCDRHHFDDVEAPLSPAGCATAPAAASWWVLILMTTLGRRRPVR